MSWPPLASAATTCLPANPVSPVTSAFMEPRSIDGSAALRPHLVNGRRRRRVAVAPLPLRIDRLVLRDPGRRPILAIAVQRSIRHRIGLTLIRWTTNDKPTMRTLLDDGADGIITDYPDRLREVLAERRTNRCRRARSTGRDSGIRLCVLAIPFVG